MEASRAAAETAARVLGGDFVRETFFYTLHAILPILLTILLGYCVRRVGTWSDEFYRQLNSLCFRLFLPIQLFCNVYAIEDLSSMNWKMIGYLFGSVFFCLLVGLVAARLLVPDRRQQGVIIQVSFRSNQAILGLPLANALGGAAAMGFASMATSVCVPLFNVLAMVVFGVPIGFFLMAMPFLMTKGIAVFGFIALIPIAMVLRILIYGALMVYLAEKKLDYLG